MSGTFADGVRAERARFLAWLADKHRAQATVAQQYPSAELNALVEDRRRQLEVMIEEIEGEMHLTDEAPPPGEKPTTMA